MLQNVNIVIQYSLANKKCVRFVLVDLEEVFTMGHLGERIKRQGNIYDPMYGKQ